MGDYLPFNNKRSVRRRRRRRKKNVSVPETILEDGRSRTCMPLFLVKKHHRNSPSVPHTEQSDEWEDYLGSTTSSEPLLPPDPWKTSMGGTISEGKADGSSTTDNKSTSQSKQPQHHLLIPPTPTNRRRGRVTEEEQQQQQQQQQPETVNFDASTTTSFDVDGSFQPQYQSLRGSGSARRRRRRSPVYEGEQEPEGIRGQEASVVKHETPSPASLPSMRSFSSNKGHHPEDPFVVSPLTDVQESLEEEDDSFNHDFTFESTESSINIMRMRDDLMPSPEREGTPEKEEQASLLSLEPTPNNTMDLNDMEQDLLRVANTRDYDGDSSQDDESSVEESSPPQQQLLYTRSRPKSPLAGGGGKTSSSSMADLGISDEDFDNLARAVSQDNDESGIVEHPSFTLVAPLSENQENNGSSDDSSSEEQQQQRQQQVPYITQVRPTAPLSGAAKTDSERGFGFSDNDFNDSSNMASASVDQHVAPSVANSNGVAYESLVTTSSTMSDDFNHWNVSPIHPPPRSVSSSTRPRSPSRRYNNKQQQEESLHNVEELNAAAIRHVEMGEYNHALQLFETVLQIYLQQYGKVHPLVASTRHNLGLVHSKRASLLSDGALKQEALTQSLKQFQAAARCARDSLGKNHPNVAASLVRIGFLLMDCKEFEKAVITFEEALRVRLEYYGQHHSLVANLWNDLGVCHTHLQNWNEALEKTTLALNTQRALDAQVPDIKMQLEIADTLCNLGGLYLERMQHSSTTPQHVEWARHAVSAFCEALDIRLRVLQDASHPLVVQARSLHDMAQSTYRDLKKKYTRTTSPSMSTLRTTRSFGSVVDEDDLSSRFFQSGLEEESFEIKRGAWSAPVARQKNMPLHEVMVQEHEERDLDSLGDSESPRRMPDGSTKIWVSPHVIPTRSPPRSKQEDTNDNVTDSVYQQDLTNEDCTMDTNEAMQTTQHKRERTYSYDAEESCLIGTDANHLIAFDFTQSKDAEVVDSGAKHEIMVVQPTNTFDEKAIQPLVARKTISWAQAVHEPPPPNHVDSPSLTLHEQDSMYEFDQADQSGGGAKPAIVTREMMEHPEDHLEEVHYAASKFLKENRLHEADILFDMVLQCQRQKHGELHEEVGAAFHNMGLVHLRAERHLEALDAFEKAVRVRKGALGRDHPDVAVSLVKVGITQLLLHRFELALMSFRDALSIRRHSLGSLHPSLARIYSNIGCVHLEFNEVREARRAFEGALDIQRNALCEEPESGPLMFGTATTLCNLGYLYKSRGMDGKAAVIFKEAVTLQEVVLGPKHPTVLSTLDSLADANTKSNNCASALKCYKEILQRFPEERESDGKVKNHRRKRAEAVILYKMSRVHRRQNDRESELEKLRAALAIVQELADTTSSNNRKLTERLERGIQNDIQRVQNDLAKSNMDWV